MKEIKLSVEGIECGGCENRIQNAVANIENVENVVASHIDGTVIVTAEDNVDVNAIKETIEDIGFKVKE